MTKQSADVEHLHPLTAAARGWVLLAVLIWRAIRLIDFDEEKLAITFPERGEVLLLVGISVLYLLVTVVGGFVVVQTTRFRLGEHRLEVETGWVSRSSQAIPYESVYSVELTRAFSARLLGLATLQIGGGQDQSIRFEYLGLKQAQRIQDSIWQLKEQADQEDPSQGVPETSQKGAILVTVPPTRVAQARLRSLTPVIMLLGAVIIVPWTLLAGNYTALIAAAVVAVSGIGNWVWGILKAGTVELSLEGSNLTLHEGRFDKNAKTVGLRRVISVELTQPLLWRGVGLYRLQLNAFGSSSEDLSAGGSTLSLDAVTWHEAAEVIGAVWSGVEFEPLLTRTLPSRARTRFPVAARTLRWGYTTNLLAARRGRFGVTWSLASLSRLQAVTLDAGPFMRRRALATVNLWMPNGSGGLVSIPGVDATEALGVFEDLAQVAARTK